MLTDRQQTLITAAVDGELTLIEASDFRELLRASAEARDLHARLKADRDRLHDLPCVAPPADLQKRIMARVAACAPPVRVSIVTPATPSAPRRRYPSWLPAAVAAGLFLCATGGSYWFFTNQADPDDRTVQNEKQPNPTDQGKGGDTTRQPGEVQPAPVTPPEHPQTPIAVRPEDTVPVTPPAPKNEVSEAPAPRMRNPLGSAPSDLVEFNRVEVRLPFLRPLAEFEREDTRHQFAQELAQDPAARIDLFTRDPAAAAIAFRQAARPIGLKILEDATTVERLRKQQVSAVAVYTESLTAKELANLFGRVRTSDAKNPTPALGSLHAMPATVQDNQDLKELFGTDPGLFKRAMPAKAEAAGKSDEKTAMLLTWGPAGARTPPSASKQLEEFLAKRKSNERKPNVVPVVIVIRQGNG